MKDVMVKQGTTQRIKRSRPMSALLALPAAAALLCAPVLALAQAADIAQPAQPPQPVVRVSEVGHSTNAWLDLQRSNAQAAPAQPMLGAEAGLAYRRYMESFKSRIPDLYGSSLGSSGASGNAGGGSGGSSISGTAN